MKIITDWIKWSSLPVAALLSANLIAVASTGGPAWSIWLSALSCAVNWMSSGRFVVATKRWDMEEWDLDAREAELRHRVREREKMLREMWTGRRE